MAQWTAATLALVASISFAPAARAQAPDEGPAEQPPERAPPEQPAPTEPDVPDVDDEMLAELPQSERVLRSWRQALKLIRTRSTAMRISQAQIAQARGLSRRALAGALPRLTGRASVTRHLLFGTGVNFGTEGVELNARIPDPATDFQAALELRQPLLAFGTWYGVGTAKVRARAARMSAKDTERLMLGTVAEAAVAVVTAQRVAEVSRVSLRSALSTLSLTRRRALLGAASAVDVLRAEQEVASSRAQVVSADESVRQAREALGLALGDSRPWGVTDTIRLGDLARTAAEVCQPVQDIGQRSDVRAAALNVEAAERTQESVDYRYAPELDLTSTLSYLGNRNRSPNGEHITWTVGALLTWPLYDGGDREGERTTAAAESTIAREQLTETKRNARLEVHRARRAIQVAQANLQVSVRSREIAKESARLAKVAFINGSGTSFDLVDTARRLREAEIDLAIKEFELIRAQIAAFLAQANCGI